MNMGTRSPEAHSRKGRGWRRTGVWEGAAASVVRMADDPRNDNEDEFRDMLREFLSGNSDIDPARLASAAGLPADPELIKRMMDQLQTALASSGEGINWSIAKEQAKN